MLSLSGMSTALQAGQGSATSKSIEARWVRQQQPKHRGSPTDLIVEKLRRGAEQHHQSLLLLTTSLIAARLPIATTHEGWKDKAKGRQGMRLTRGGVVVDGGVTRSEPL
jgi:hypothetical protein